MRTQLAGILASRDETLAKDSLLTNCYVESTPLGKMVIKRPGFRTFASLGAGCAQGAITYNGGALFVQNDNVVTNIQPISTGALWTGLTTPPKPTNGDSWGTTRPGYLVSHDGALYHIGAKNNLDGFGSVYKSIDDGTTWTTLLSLSTPWAANDLIVGNAVVSFNGLIYILLQSKAIWSTSDGINWVRNTVDLTSGSPTTTGECLIVHNGQLYAFVSANTPAVWSSSNGSSWTSVNGSIAALGVRNGFRAESLNGILYIMGGRTAVTSTYNNDVYKSVNNGVVWTSATASAIWSTRGQMASWVYNNRLWIASGKNALNADVYNSLDGASWSTVTGAAGWAARFGAGCCVHNNTMYLSPGLNNTVAVSSLFKAEPGTAVNAALPTPTSPCNRMQITLIPANGSTPVKVFIKSNTDAWVYDGTTATKVTDVDYPISTVWGVAYLDGTIYVMDAKGQINGSDLLNPTSWDALNFITANSESDGAVALVRQLNALIAFKQFSSEFFIDGGNPTGSPLSKYQSSYLEIGCASPDSIAYTDNTIYFMANSRQNGRSIMRMNGYTPEIVSTSYIDSILNLDDLDTVYAFFVKSKGHGFYFLTLGTSAVTLVYDAVESLWFNCTKMTALSSVSATSLALQTDGTILVTMPFAAGQSDGDPVTISGLSQTEYNGAFNLTYNTAVHSASQFSYVPLTTPTVTPATGSPLCVFYQETRFPGAFYAKGDNVDLILDEVSGAVYKVDPLYFQDSGNPINVRCRLTNADGGVTQMKTYKELVLIGDKYATNVLCRSTSDDYQTYSVYRPMNMNLKRPILKRLGQSYRRAYEFRHTENAPLRLLAIDEVIV